MDQENYDSKTHPNKPCNIDVLKTSHTYVDLFVKCLKCQKSIQTSNIPITSQVIRDDHNDWPFPDQINNIACIIVITYIFKHLVD